MSKQGQIILVTPVVLLLLQTRGVFNDNELNICDEYPFETWNTCTLSKEEPITTGQMTLWGNSSNKIPDGVVFSCQQIGVNPFFKCIEFQVNSFDSY
jgi:hypothetical protein